MNEPTSNALTGVDASTTPSTPSAPRMSSATTGKDLIRALGMLPVLVLQYVIFFPLALQIEAALGFLGLGVVPPTPDWGAILEQGKNFILVAWWMSLWPGLFVLLSAVAVTSLGRGLRDRLAR